MALVYVGTSGWSYPSGEGRWSHIVYPPGRRDELGYYSQLFPAVEVNTSFYRPLEPRVATSWVQRTPEGFRFALKLWQRFTHQRGSVWEEPWTQEDVDVVRSGLEPFAAVGKLGALLLQFPASFRRTEASLSLLEALLETFRAYPLAVELRHRSWRDAAETARLLGERGVAWCWIDEPRFRTSIARSLPVTAPLGYLRFHGRNAAQWWRGDRETRYDYLYAPTEVEGLAERVRQAAENSSEVYAFFNNHYRGKAVVNAFQLQQALGQPVTPPPPMLAAAYPELESLRMLASGDSSQGGPRDEAMVPGAPLQGRLREE